MRFHQGSELQRGRGFGALFSGLMRSFIPIAKAGLKAGKRVLQSDFAKSLGSKALDVGKDMVKNIAADVLAGESFSNAASNEVDVAKKKISEAIRGSGRRSRCRKRKRTRTSIKGRKRLRFNLLE
jgi:hypothetical protein